MRALCILQEKREPVAPASWTHRLSAAAGTRKTGRLATVCGPGCLIPMAASPRRSRAIKGPWYDAGRRSAVRQRPQVLPLDQSAASSWSTAWPRGAAAGPMLPLQRCHQSGNSLAQSTSAITAVADVIYRHLSTPTPTADAIGARPCRSRKRPRRAGIKRLKLLSRLNSSLLFLPSRLRTSSAVESLQRDLSTCTALGERSGGTRSPCVAKNGVRSPCPDAQQ